MDGVEEPAVITIGERVGPVFSRAQMVEAGLDLADLVAIRWRGGEDVYPAAQFDVAEGRLQLRADVAAIWAELGGSGMDALSCWLWLTERRDSLGGFTPLQYLTRRGQDARLTAELRALVAPAMAA